VARSNPAAESWGVFMRSRMAAMKLNQAEFRRRMAAAGNDISKQTASQWANGDNAPDANTVLAVAQVLEARDTDALRAAGFDPVADRLEKQGVEGGGALRGEPVDPVIDYIMGMAELSMKFRQTLIDEYLEDQATIKRRARNMAQRLASRTGDGDDSDEAGAA
jgi:transcriptional regulator with XRE-family HTH domain